MSNGQLIRVKIYRAVIYVAAVILVVLAILFSIARVMLDDLGKYRDTIERQVSTLLDQKVQIQGFDARLEGITPVLIFKNVALLHSNTNKELTRFSEARIGLAILASIRERQFVPGEITIDGINILLTRRKNGEFNIQGLDISQIESGKQVTADTQLAKWLFTYADLSLENSAIVWQDNIQGKRYQFNDVNLHLINSGQRHILTGQLEVPEKLGRNVKFSADFEGDSLKPQEWQGTFFLQAFSVDSKQWKQFQPQWNGPQIKDGQLDVRLWGAWQNNHLTNLSGDLSVYDLILLNKSEKRTEFKLIAGLFDWKRTEKDWSVQVQDFQVMHQGSVWPKTNLHVFYDTDNDDRYQLAADYLRIEDAHKLLSAVGKVSDDVLNILNKTSPSGDVKNLNANIIFKNNQVHDYVLKAQLNNLNTMAWNSYPAVQGFRAEITSTKNYGELKVENNFSTLHFPKLFRRAFGLHQLNAHIRWQKNEQGWLLSSDNVVANTADIKAHANLFLQLPSNKTSPYMDLQVQFRDGDASQASTYYPVGIMEEGLVKWLEQGVVGGNVSFGGAVFNGRLSDFPFKRKQGAFQVQFYADNVELDYLNDWPHLTNSRIDANFTGEGMQIKGLHAQLLKQTLSENIEVEIKDFLNPELQLHAKTSGPINEVFDFLVNSPVAPEAKDFVESIDMRGENTLKLELYVPLNKKMAVLKPLHYRGNLMLSGNDFMLLDKAVDIRAVNGSLAFDERGLSAKAIKATIMGDPAVMDVYTQDYKYARPVQIVAAGTIDTGKLGRRFDVPGLDKVSGKTAWQGVLTLPYKQQIKDIPAKLSFTSSLKNVNISLPKPLDKPNTTTVDFGMSVEFSDNDVTKMTFQYSDLIQAVLGLESHGEHLGVVKGALNFGKTIPEMPTDNLLRLEGSSDALPVKAWVNIFKQKNKTESKDTYNWKKMPVDLAMERLHLLLEPDSNDVNSTSEVNALPHQWPLLNGVVKELVINESKIGKIELDIEREQYGFKINTLNLTTSFSQVEASGGWHYQRQHQTVLNLGMKTKDLGAQLSQWGFAAIIKGGTVENSQARVAWPDNPFGFEFAKLNGTMSVNIEEGNIVEVNPGAGRLFGLLSLSELPRRLFLDFADMKTGFSFDTVQAKFDIKDGNAITKNLTVDSTLAKVVVDGRTGLSDQDYDLNVLVIPNVSGTAPLPAWALWGPQVGAAFLFLKELFGSQFDKSIARAYQVSGSWEKPVIEKVEAESSTSEE